MINNSIVRDIMVLLEANTGYFEIMGNIERLHSGITARQFKEHYKQAEDNIKNGVVIKVNKDKKEKILKKKVKYSNKKEKHTEEFISKLIELYNAGYTYKEMCVEFKKSQPTITYAIAKLINDGVIERRHILKKKKAKKKNEQL